MSNSAIGDTSASPAEQAGAASTIGNSSSSSSSKVTSGTPIHSLADLMKKAPKVYKAMMEGIAMNITHEMEKHQARLKQLMEDAKKAAQGQ